MSSNTKDDTSESSPPQNKLAIAQKKLKVLKNALKQEREEKKNVEKELEAAIKNNEILKNVISEKENKFLQLYQENANLQEALLRETKGSSSVKKTPVAKPPLFVSNNAGKGKNETSAIDNVQQSEAYELLQSKCKGYEEQLIKNDEEFKKQKHQIEQYKLEIYNLQQLFESRLQEIHEEKNHFQSELKIKEKEWNFKIQEKDLEIQNLKQECEKKIKAIKDESQNTVEQLNIELDKNLKTGEFIDSLNDKIINLEKDLQRSQDEANLGKEVIDSLTKSLMKHEKESGELAQKLSIMKNQILEQQIGSGIGKKFAAVKIGRLNKKTVSFEFVEDKADDFYLIIDSKDQEISVSFDNIDEVSENKDGKLNILYYVPNGDSGNLQKRNENFECFEKEEFLKVYTNIKASLILKNQHQIQKQNTFNPQTKPLTPSMSKNSRKLF